MKKVFLSLLATSLVFFTTVFVVAKHQDAGDAPFRVAMISGIADIDDNSFNQSTYEGCKEWCSGHDIPFTYYKPAANSNAERGKCVELAIERGYNVLFLPGYQFGDTIAQFANKYPDVTFYGIDVTESDLPSTFIPGDNVFCFSYHEEIAGYLAGYASTKEGYKKHGFLGGMKGLAVTRFGYGYVQGVDAAASEMNIDAEINFVYGGQFYGDNDITKYVDNWYKGGTEIVFACGGGIYTSAALAARDNGGKIIGVDSDQSIVVDRDYGEGICITSAMKCIPSTIKTVLDSYADEIASGETFAKLGLVSSSNIDENYVGLPIDTWSMTNFTVEDYKVVVDDILKGKCIISDEVNSQPTLSSHTTLKEFGSIK